MHFIKYRNLNLVLPTEQNRKIRQMSAYPIIMREKPLIPLKLHQSWVKALVFI